MQYFSSNSSSSGGGCGGGVDQLDCPIHCAETIRDHNQDQYAWTKRYIFLNRQVYNSY